MPALLVAEARFPERVGRVVANDAGRTTLHRPGGRFAATPSPGATCRRWPRGPSTPVHGPATPVGRRRSSPSMSGPGAVVLRHRNGPVWGLRHTPWAGDFESGCTWFDHLGRPLAVIPTVDYDGCLVVALSRAAGQVVAELPIATVPGRHPARPPPRRLGRAVGGRGPGRGPHLVGPPVRPAPGHPRAHRRRVERRGAGRRRPLGQARRHRPPRHRTPRDLDVSRPGAPPAHRHAQPRHLLGPHRLLRRPATWWPASRANPTSPWPSTATASSRSSPWATGGWCRRASARGSPSSPTASAAGAWPETPAPGGYCTPSSRSTQSMAK